MKNRFNPLGFDVMDYVAEFDFCDTEEKERVCNALLVAWRWGASMI